MSYLKAEPHRFKDKLPIWEAIAPDESVFYLFGILPNAEGKLDMELLKESGILGLLAKCDHLITEFKKVNLDLENFLSEYLISRLMLEDNEYSGYYEFKTKMKNIVPMVINFELEEYSLANFNQSISHLHSDTKRHEFVRDIPKGGYESRIYLELSNHGHLIERLSNYYYYVINKDYRFLGTVSPQTKKYISSLTRLQFLTKLSEEREIKIQKAYLNMDTVQMAYYLGCSDLPIRVFEFIQEATIDIRSFTFRKWLNKIKSHLDTEKNQKTFIALDIGCLLPEYIDEINIIKQLEKEGFEIRQLSLGDIEHISN
jgi:hypothetical protein